MPKPIRRLAAPLAILALVVSLAHPALARNVAFEEESRASEVPVMFDVLVMRPLGLVATVTGTLVYLFPVVPIMAVTRPKDIAKPIRPLIGAPAQFTFGDPIGHHP